jgi:hypothetical protein
MSCKDGLIAVAAAHVHAAVVQQQEEAQVHLQLRRLTSRRAHNGHSGLPH